MFRTNQRLPATFAPIITTALAAEAEERNLNFHNNTGDTIYRLYDTNSGLTCWGNDAMGSATQPDGIQLGLRSDNKYNQCKFDFRIEFENGTSTQERRVDPSRVGYFTWN